MRSAYGQDLGVARDRSRDRLIAEHVDMARRIALRVGRRVPDWLTQDDLVAAAMLGLAEAADRYDTQRGEPFVAFAEKRVRGAVLDELRRGDLMPRRMRTTARKVGDTIRSLEQRFGRAPEDEEIARALDVPVQQYREELEMLTHVSFVDVGSEAEAIPSDDAPVAAVEHRQLAGRLRSHLNALTEREQLVMSLYYVEELSYSEIGGVLGVSESRICQIHGRALARLRTAMAEEER